MVETTAAPSRIPAFASLEEEAEFWDTHSTADYEDEWEPVSLEVVQPFRHGLTVSFDSETFRRLSALSKARGVSMFDLAEQWVVEAIAREDQADGDDPSERTATG